MPREAQLDDILIAIAHFLPKGRKCFRYGAEKLNSFFYQQKQQYPQLFKSLLFDTNGTFPICEEIYKAVSRLFTSGLVVVPSHKQCDYHFHPAIEGSFQESVIKRLSKQQLNDLERLAQEFNKQVAIDESLSVK